MKTASLFVAPLVLTLFAAGCGSSGEASGSVPASASGQPASGQPAASSETATGRVVEIKVTDKGFEPKTVEAKKGETVSLKFTRSTESECLKAISIPSLNVKRDLPMNQPVVVNVPANSAGKIGFQCWMGMVKGEIDVKDESGS